MVRKSEIQKSANLADFPLSNYPRIETSSKRLALEWKSRRRGGMEDHGLRESPAKSTGPLLKIPWNSIKIENQAISEWSKSIYESASFYWRTPIGEEQTDRGAKEL